MRPLPLWIVLSLLLASTACLADPPSSSSGGIVKWVDDKGVTHYGDSVPPEYANRSSEVLNKSGRVLRRNEVSKPSTQQAQSAEQQKQLAEQQRRDGVLLASYTTEQEIDLARERSTQMDEAAIKALEQRGAGVQERLAMHQKTAEGFTARNKPVPADLKQDIDSTRGEARRIQEQIALKRKNIEETRIRFDQDKRRFHELKAMGAARSSSQP